LECWLKRQNLVLSLINSRVVIIELFGNLDGAGRLVSVEDAQEKSNNLTSLLEQLFSVQNDSEVLFLLSQFHSHNLRFLVLEQKLTENIVPLGVGLAPLLALRVEKFEAKDSFAKGVHDICPKHIFHLEFLNSENRINFRKYAKIPPTSVCSAFFKRS